ncbi:hypothetical protein evm_007949 [Chilo suppressalis]|nr:hypothetical protein evm_007949 [Chilo suppressalis]
MITARLRKLIVIFKSLRHVAEDNVIKSVYYALCQSLLSYCITNWGGVPKTTLLKLERAQRVILKVAVRGRNSSLFADRTLEHLVNCTVTGSYRQCIVQFEQVFIPGLTGPLRKLIKFLYKKSID